MSCDRSMRAPRRFAERKLAPRRSASANQIPGKYASDRSAPTSQAPRTRACFIRTPRRTAPETSAPDSRTSNSSGQRVFASALAPCNSHRSRSASRRSAPVRYAHRRVAPRRLAARNVALRRSAYRRSAPASDARLKSAPDALTWLRSAPSRLVPRSVDKNTKLPCNRACPRSASSQLDPESKPRSSDARGARMPRRSTEAKRASSTVRSGKSRVPAAYLARRASEVSGVEVMTS